MKVQVYIKKLLDICFYETLSFMIMKVIVFYEKKFMMKRKDVL